MKMQEVLAEDIVENLILPFVSVVSEEHGALGFYSRAAPGCALRSCTQQLITHQWQEMNS